MNQPHEQELGDIPMETALKKAENEGLKDKE